MENVFNSYEMKTNLNPHKIEEKFNLYVGMLVDNKFEDRYLKDFGFNKILYCFSNEHLKTGFSTQSLEKLNVDQVEQLIEHNSEQLECRINFITEAIYRKPEINYVFFRNIVDKLVFNELKKVTENYKCYIGNSVSKLNKALIIKHITSLKEYQSQNVVIYISSRTHNHDDIFNVNNLKTLNIDDLNIINNTLINNYLMRMNELGDDLGFMLKMQKDFEKQQRFNFFK